MDTALVITITSSICGMIITLLLMAATIFGGSLKGKINRLYLVILVVVFAGCACDMMVSFLIGTQMRLLLQIVNFTSYALGGLCIVIIPFYFYEYLSKSAPVSKKPFRFITGMGVLYILLAAVSELTEVFQWLDENNYYRAEDTLWVLQVPYIIGMLIVIFSTVKYAKQVGKRAHVTFISYLVLQLGAYAIELSVENAWVSYFASAAICFIMYINIQVELEGRAQVELEGRAREQELELAESRIAMMLSQIQPHFLYNSLTSIAVLCKLDPDKAQTAVTDFAHYLRSNLDSLQRRRMILFSDELDHVETYLALEKLRYGDKLRVEIDTPEMDFMLPPLTVQPIVENAVKHGIMKKEEGGRIKISTEAQGDLVQITVSDDGAGFTPEGAANDGRIHVGIENVRERLRAQCGGTLEIKSTPGEGTAASLILPLFTPEKPAVEIHREADE